MKFAVIIPIFNKANTIERTIESILSQSIDCAIIVVNDGSTDNSLAKIQYFHDSQIHIINQENKGVSASRNAGIKYAIDNHYTHIGLLDADDYWLLDYLKSIKSLIELHPNASVFATNYKYQIKPDFFKYNRFSGEMVEGSQIITPYFEYNHLNSILFSSNAFYEVGLFEKTGYFNTAYSHGEDIDFFIRCGIYGQVAFSSNIAVVVDRSASNRSDQMNYFKRIYIDLNVYTPFEKEYKGLKRYLNLNRYALAIQSINYKDFETTQSLKKQIDTTLLSHKQRWLLKQKSEMVRLLLRMQRLFLKLGLDLRTGN